MLPHERWRGLSDDGKAHRCDPDYLSPGWLLKAWNHQRSRIVRISEMQLFFLSALVIGIAMLGMSIGVLVSNRCLRGSCGGPDVIGPTGESLSCSTCPNRSRPTDDEPPGRTAA